MLLPIQQQSLHVAGPSSGRFVWNLVLSPMWILDGIPTCDFTYQQSTSRVSVRMFLDVFGMRDGGWWWDIAWKDRKGDLTWSMKQTPVLGPHGAPSKGLIGFKRQSHAHRPRTHTADAGCMNRLDGKTSFLFAFIGPILCRMNLGLWRACSSWQQWMVWFCCVFLSKPRKSPRACLRKARIQSLLVPCAQAFPLRGYGNQSSYCWKTCWHATSMASKSRPASVCQEKCKCMLMGCLSFVAFYCHVFFPVEKRSAEVQIWSHRASWKLPGLLQAFRAGDSQWGLAVVHGRIMVGILNLFYI